MLRRLALYLAVGVSLAPIPFAAGGKVAAASSASLGCATRAPSGLATDTVEAGGHRRQVLVFAPKSLSAHAPAALVVNLHGSGSTALDQAAFSGMDVEARTAGFIVAYPQGIIPDGQGFDWNVPHEPLVGGRPVPQGSPDDVTFLTGLVGFLEGRYCIDTHEVYATGFSGGARMASQLACDASGVFAAVAPVSGLRIPSPCPTTRAVPVLSFHGTADPIDPYAGHGQAYWTYSVPEAATRWAHHDGCDRSPKQSTPVAGVTLYDYRHCSGGAEVELYAISGEGHEWPGGPSMPPLLTSVLGPQSAAVNADAIMWDFFRAHPLP